MFFFFFVFLAQGDIPEKILVQAVPEILLPMFSSRIFMISSLKFKSLLHFEFTHVCGVKRWPSVIFFARVQFSQHHLLNIIFTSLYVLAPFI